MITELETETDHALLSRTLDELYRKTGAVKRIGIAHHDPLSLMIHCEALLNASNAVTSARMNGRNVNIGVLNQILSAVEREV